MEPEEKTEQKTVTLSMAEKIIGLILCISTICGSYLATRALTDYRIAALEHRLDNHETRLVQEEQFGHPDHEKRITKLETVDTDRWIIASQENTKQIQALTEAVAKDHDSLVRITTVLEKQVSSKQ